MADKLSEGTGAKGRKRSPGNAVAPPRSRASQSGAKKFIRLDDSKVVTVRLRIDGKEIQAQVRGGKVEIEKQHHLLIKNFRGYISKSGRFDVHDFKDAAADELAKLGVPAVLAGALEGVLAEFEADLTSPPISSKLRSKLPKLLAMAAAVPFRAAALPKDAKQNLKDDAPRLWRDREPSDSRTPEQFLKDEYAGRLGIDGDLTQADLGRLDTALLTALNREFKGRRAELHALLPTLQARNDAKLLREHGYVPRGDDRKSKLTTSSRRDRPSP